MKETTTDLVYILEKAGKGNIRLLEALLVFNFFVRGIWVLAHFFRLKKVSLEVWKQSNMGSVSPG